MALAGTLRGSKSAELGGRISELVRRSRGGLRDAMLEAWAEIDGSASDIVGWAKARGERSDRVKAAEVLGRSAGRPFLLELTKDGDGAVRAAAAWGLGQAGLAEDVKILVPLLRDRDVSVAANAAAALGRLGRRLDVDVAPALCSELVAPAAFVRVNVFAALRVSASACPFARIERALERDGSALVRERAAELAWTFAARGEERALRSLERCGEEDPSGSVAIACREPPAPIVDPRLPVTVFVVPSNGTEPLPEAPFALVFSDRLTRLGTADRRGAVLELAAPTGPMWLEVPSPGAE
jgi:hypothetical protein